MSLKGILAINGMSGLYKVVAQTKAGFIVESLADQKRIPVTSVQRISMLEDISVYTITDDMPLKDVFLKMLDYVKTKELADAKSDPAVLKSFFKEVIADYDTERVYPSDIKKVIIWFNMVKDFVGDEEEESTTNETSVDAPADNDSESK